MKNILFLAVAFLTITINAQNIAYIQQDTILAVLPNYKTNFATIEKLRANYQQEVKTSKELWASKIEKLMKPYNVKENEELKTIKSRMSAVDTTSLGILADEDKLLSKKAQNYDLILKNQYINEIQPLLEKVNKALEKYASVNKIDIIYIIEQLRPALAYIDKKKNITAAITGLLK